MVLLRLLLLASELGAAGAFEQALQVHADERGGYQSEVRQGRIAAADLGRVQKDFAEVAFAGEALEARTRVGNRAKLLAVFLGQLPEMREERHNLDRSAGLAGDHKERVPRVDGVV